MRLKPSWVIGSTLGALWMVSCGSSDQSTIFSEQAGSAGFSGGAGASSGGSSNSGGASSGGANNAGSSNAGSSNAGSSNAGSANGGSANGGSANGGSSGDAGGGNAGSNGGAQGGSSAGNDPGAGTGGTSGAAGRQSGGAGGVSGGVNGGTGGIVIASCKTNDDCDSGEYCHKNSCLEQANGTCVPMPESCPSVEADVSCGCDGYTYFEPCLAAWNGVNIATIGVCGELSHRHCVEDDECVPDRKGATCVDVHDSCLGSVGAAECWVLPEQCPAVDPPRYQRCGSDNDECFGLCEAARSGDPYALDDSCG